MGIYTRGGDKGQTSLLSGQRVFKHAPRVEAYGTLDELLSALGAARAFVPVPEEALSSALRRVQQELILLAARVAAQAADELDGLPELPGDATEALEAEIDGWTRRLPELRSFVLPGGTPAAGLLQLARTICRRAERRVSLLGQEEDVPPEAAAYLNRLSDWIFTAARWANHAEGRGDELAP